MAAPRRSAERDRRIHEEVVVDTNNAEERALGWYYYLEGRLAFPFEAQCIASRDISPLKKGERVAVIGLASEDDCRSEILVRIRWEGRRLAVPLAQLTPLAGDREAREAIADWHYWRARGYEF